ncbi:MAG: hypothetical protein AB7E08_05750 [Candidatus Omnitrophota bacterium]
MSINYNFSYSNNREERRETEKKWSEENIKTLISKCGYEENIFSNGYAVLKIDVSLMTPEERQKLYEAEKILNELGIDFDTGMGGGFRDWFLDWSLSGAILRTKRMACLHCDTGKINYFAIMKSPEGNVVSFPFCSVDCFQAKNYELSGWKLLSWESKGE